MVDEITTTENNVMCLSGRSSWFLVLPLVIFFAFSWPKSFTGDEALTAHIAGQSYDGLLDTVSANTHVPGYYTYLWIWSHLFGNSLLSLRLSSFLIVLMLVAFSFRRLPAIPAVLIALSPFTLHLAIELRMYGMLALGGLLLLLVLRRYVARQDLISLLMVAAVASFCSWVHFFGWTALAAAGTIVAKQKKWKHLLILVTIVLLLFAPWAGRLIDQVGIYTSDIVAGESEYMYDTSVQDRLVGIPFSLGGALLKFTGGTGVFHFSTQGIDSLDFWMIIGAVLGLLVLFQAVRGFRKTGSVPISILLWTLLPLSYFRPGARHFSLAFVSYFLIVSKGLPLNPLRKKATVAVIALMMVVLNLPMAFRTTMPQRGTFDRDFREAAALALRASEDGSIPIVMHLDFYSSLGMLYHLEDMDCCSRVLHPHTDVLEEGVCFYINVADGLRYLEMDTDSLIESWKELSGEAGSFLLIANDPREARGRVFGEEGKEFIGMGSDIMADLDLIECLEAVASLTEIELINSSGPFSLFEVEPFEFK